MAERSIGKRERDLYDLLLKEKERVIIVLSDQIDYLRYELGKDRTPLIPTEANLNGEALQFDMQAWVSEEEQDLSTLVETGRLSKEEAEAAFAELTETSFND